MANTKLTEIQKEIRKDLKAQYSDFTIKNNGETTIVYRVEGNTVKFTTSVMAPDEQKFRRKVGEYIALNRLDDGQFVVMSKADFIAMLSLVYMNWS